MIGHEPNDLFSLFERGGIAVEVNHDGVTVQTRDLLVEFEFDPVMAVRAALGNRIRPQKFVVIGLPPPRISGAAQCQPDGDQRFVIFCAEMRAQTRSLGS